MVQHALRELAGLDPPYSLQWCRGFRTERPSRAFSGKERLGQLIQTYPENKQAVSLIKTNSNKHFSGYLRMQKQCKQYNHYKNDNI